MKKENKGKKFKISSFIITMFLLLYIPSVLHWITEKNVSTDYLRNGILEDSVNADGIIIRDETVYNSPFDGKYIPEVGEGEKVAAGGRIATVMAASSVELLDELENYNQRIIKAQIEKNKNREFFSEDIGRLDNEIGKKIQVIVNEVNNNSLYKIEQLKSDIDRLVHKKAEIYGGRSTADTYIDQLKNERDLLQQRIKNDTKGEISASPGIVSYVIDGLEKELNPSAIDKLTVEYLENLKISTLDVNANMRDVTAGQPYVKVIDNLKSYIAVIVKADKAKTFEVGMKPRVRIYDIDKEIRGTIEHISPEENGKVIIVVGIDRCIDETAGIRKVNIDLIKDSYEGLKVPLRSLMDVDLENNKAKIILVKANYASIREVEIVVASDEYAIIKSADDSGNKGISLYDSYIINPQNIEEGQIINK
ncbi:MAG TPA: hypothetical protein GXX36_00505 [Clostridiaceae bacterium]|nr:hypothetical protein [Clostridiaceae bacterium]